MSSTIISRDREEGLVSRRGLDLPNLCEAPVPVWPLYPRIWFVVQRLKPEPLGRVATSAGFHIFEVISRGVRIYPRLPWLSAISAGPSTAFPI